ncbi:glycosyl hydrolase family 61-domain-containing protein [Epithele typhae]|uniref:glycosyl hydrolase family 61-domain-containing protein n=1 Tax=Epithele typhae TaxID=378194 RepID=UPI00200751E8|nr:glycosyl hydrolase family 61-domain-containing protein [Epithele typhae]KAH9919785.1 glycosyl hydrolase family 61-domain-containing protein [Epithele typhae]
METSAAVTTSTASPAATLPLVADHGFVSWLEIDGARYLSNVPKGPSPIPPISDISPPAEIVAPANSGSTAASQWSGGAGQKRPYNTGPLMTYMASCGDIGKKSDGKTWLHADIMNGESFIITLPNNLTPGEYLIRHEVIALHLAVIEFYSSYTQARIGGSGNGTPNGTVTFLGAYSDTDPGIFDQIVLDDDDKYDFPGGALSNLAGTSTLLRTTQMGCQDGNWTMNGSGSTALAERGSYSATALNGEYSLIALFASHLYEVRTFIGLFLGAALFWEEASTPPIMSLPRLYHASAALSLQFRSLEGMDSDWNAHEYMESLLAAMKFTQLAHLPAHPRPQMCVQHALSRWLPCHEGLPRSLPVRPCEPVPQRFVAEGQGVPEDDVDAVPELVKGQHLTRRRRRRQISGSLRISRPRQQVC